MPSTSTPKIIWLRTESSICIRGSADGSFERRRKMRPSSGFSLRSLGNETEKLGPAAGEKDAETRKPVINAIRTPLGLLKNIQSPGDLAANPADCTTNDSGFPFTPAGAPPSAKPGWEAGTQAPSRLASFSTGSLQRRHDVVHDLDVVLHRAHPVRKGGEVGTTSATGLPSRVMRTVSWSFGLGGAERNSEP